MITIETTTNQYHISTPEEFSELFDSDLIQSDHHQPGLTLYDVTQTFIRWGLSHTVQGNEVRMDYP